MYPPALPLIRDVSADKLARMIRDLREVGVIQGPELAVRLSEGIFPDDVRRALQFVNLADPTAHNAA